jgi:hypothetical protein
MNLTLRGVAFLDLTDAEVTEALRQLIPDEEIESEIAAREERADEEAGAFEALDEIVTLDEILDRKLVPLSRSTLYREAAKGADDSPFYKRGGRWMASVGDLRAWIRSAPRGSDDPVDPMPPTCSSAADVLAAIDNRAER